MTVHVATHAYMPLKSPQQAPLRCLLEWLQEKGACIAGDSIACMPGEPPVSHVADAAEKTNPMNHTTQQGGKV